MVVRYEDLTFNKRCIYQAFTKLTGVTRTASALGAMVNAKGIDADDNEAVVCLAKELLSTENKLKPRIGSSGKFFHSETAHEPNAELIVVIASGSDAHFLNRRYPAGSIATADEILSSTDKKVTDCQWHAVHAEVNGKGAVSRWNDDQKLRPKGPWDTDFVVYYEKA